MEILVQNIAIELTNATFINIKRTCRRLAKVCRSMEPRRHWDRLAYCMDQRGAGVIWRNIISIAAYVMYNDEMPFGHVTIWTGLDKSTINGIDVDHSKDYHTSFDNGSFIERINIVSAKKFRRERCTILCVDRLVLGETPNVVVSGPRGGERLDDFIENLIEYRRFIKDMQLAPPNREYVKPPYEKVKDWLSRMPRDGRLKLLLEEAESERNSRQLWRLWQQFRQ